MPWRDEASVKEYLLRPAKRRELIRQYEGSTVTVPGVRGLQHLLQDRQFLCLHYSLQPDGGLRPCIAPAAEAAPGTDTEG